MEYRKHSPVAEFEVKDVVEAYQKKKQESGGDWSYLSHNLSNITEQRANKPDPKLLSFY